MSWTAYFKSHTLNLVQWPPWLSPQGLPGLLPQSPLDNVLWLVDYVHEQSASVSEGMRTEG